MTKSIERLKSNAPTKKIDYLSFSSSKQANFFIASRGMVRLYIRKDMTILRVRVRVRQATMTGFDLAQGFYQMALFNLNPKI